MNRFYRFAFSITVFLSTLALFHLNIASVFSKKTIKTGNSNECGYTMCQFEKDNIDQVILSHAKNCQTVMFGEIHDTALAGTPSPVEDSAYVITLLLKLKKIGYEYLALEAKRNPVEECHSDDILRFYEAYKKGQPVDYFQYPHAKPGWVELVKEAVDMDYRIEFIDDARKGGASNYQRDKAMFEEIKERIFEKDSKAKVIVYIGAYHVGERETSTGIDVCVGKRRPLGYFLNDYTRGKNFSIYMGHTYDTPVGCDLIISYFIWETYQRKGMVPEEKP